MPPSALFKAELPPGLSKRGTIYQTTGRWYDSSECRWYEGIMSPIRGSLRRITSALTGKPRAMTIWRANDNTRFFAVGTESKLYAATPTRTQMVDITPASFTAGHADAESGGGYGTGLYGAGTYGTPRVYALSVAYEATMWQLDTFGQYLTGMTVDDGLLYEWQLDISSPTAAAAISNAPTGNLGLVVTPEGFLVALGAGGDGRKLAWCDQGDNTTWSPSSTNQAGDYDIQTSGRLMCGKRTRATTIVLTDLDAHAMTYLGLPYVYSVQRIGENCGAISRGCIVAPDVRAFWWSPSGFFAFDGASVQLIPCEIYDAVFNDLNFTQRSKISAMLVSQYSEAWWFYPSAGSTENDMAVVYNYKENTWALHTIARLCGFDRGVYANPMMCSADGYVYDHETGETWAGTPYAESGPIEIGNGDRIARVRRVIFDEETAGDVVVYFKVRDWPAGSETTYGPYLSANPVPARFAGRQVRLRVEFQSAGKWGAPRFDVMQGGMR